MQENRKFPRLDLYYEGVLDLPQVVGARVSLPMLVTSVSPEGASVAVSDVLNPPADGSLVTVRFTADDVELLLPAVIAWTRRTGKRTEFGLELLLDQMPMDMAERYARWIVDRFKRKPAPLVP